jgi:hypothetical protein
MYHTTTLTKKQNTTTLLKHIIEELHLLRQELNLIVPREDLSEYAHPKRIKRAYERAMLQYPPRV